MCRSVVAYFSITGVTADVANLLAEAIGADLLEIKAQEPTQEKMARSREDQLCPEAARSADAEPVIRCKKQDLDPYDTIYVGLPIWWYAAPTVINNFLDDYDLTGKTVIPFATSGGGGIDRVKGRLESSCAGADLKEATLLTADFSREDLAKWAREINA